VWRRVVPVVVGAVLYAAAAYAQPWMADALTSEPLYRDASLLARDVTVYRDRYGIPHVVANTDAALYFGFGYVSAEDHLERILTNYRLGAGRMAELGGEQYLLSDYHARLFRLRQMVIERAGDIDLELRSMLENYVRGINYYMERHPQDVPSWAEPVVPADVIGFHRYLTIFEFVLRRYGVFGVLRPMPTGTLLAIGPNRTDGDGPILLVTCQAGLEGPLTLYESHLSSKEGTEVFGATFPGLPVMYVGCNRDIAWGFTPNAPDIADTYMLRLQSLEPLMYSYMDRLYAFWVEPTQLLVADSFGTTRPVAEQLVYSHNGPVVNAANMVAEVMRVAGWQDLNGLRQWLRVNRARSVGGFATALADMQVPALNAVCIDRQGKIYYGYCAKAPRKSYEIDWRFPVDGSRMDTEWLGFMPFDLMPQITDPPAGFVQSANGTPWRATENCPLQPTDFPPYLVEDTESVRSERLLEIMRSQNVLSLDGVKQIAWDVVVPFAHSAEQMLVAAHRVAWREYDDAGSSMLRAVQMFQRWDRRVTADSTEALLFATWWQQYRAMFPQLNDAEVMRTLARPGQQESTAGLQALRQAVDILMARYGRMDVPWGTANRTRYGTADYPAAGSSALHTIHQAVSGTDPVQTAERVGRGDLYKLVVQLDTATSVYSIMPFGNATSATSPHVIDQIELYSSQQLKRVELESPLRGRDIESAWGNTARFELDGGTVLLETQVSTPVTAWANTVDPAIIQPPLPRAARMVGPVTHFAITPYTDSCRWTLTVKVPLELGVPTPAREVPVGLIETLPGRWTPMPASWSDDGTSIIVSGRDPGAIAVYLVPARAAEPG